MSRHGPNGRRQSAARISTEGTAGPDPVAYAMTTSLRGPTGLSVSLVFLAASAASQVSFVDRAAEAGVLNPSFGRAAAMVDLDGDGLLDLIGCNAGMENRFYRQKPDHTFEQMNAAWGIAPDDRASWSLLAADFDNDGDIDVYVVNGGFFAGAVANQVLRNDLSTSGVFTDVSAASGDGAIVSWNFGGTALDYDNDGDLDVFCTVVGGMQGLVLLRNDGDLTFTDVSAESGVDIVGKYRHCSSGDYDNDGWVDIAVGRSGDDMLLLRNNGDGTFEDTTAAAGLSGSVPLTNFGLALDDFDNDGWLDLFVPKYQAAAITGTSEIYLNDGDGTFTNVTAGSNMTGQSDMGHTTGDVDGDGYPDIYIGTGNPDFLDDDVLFLVTPDGNGGLIGNDVTAAAGVAPTPTRCHGMALGDYDGDGDVDVYVNNGGPEIDALTLQEDFLFENQGNGNAWTAIELVGVRSNRGGVGAHAVATTNTGREVHRYHRVGHGFGNTSSPIQHFGIGSDVSVDRIEIRWPSGLSQVLLAPPMSTVTTVVETGLSCGDPVVPGEVFTIEFDGSAGHDATLFVSAGQVALPVPAFGGVWKMAAPFLTLADLTLDAGGQGQVPLPIPLGFGLSGFEFYAQAWVREPGAGNGGVLTDVLPIPIE